METRKKVALVTGASKGLGFEVASQIGQEGVTVLLGARNKATGEDAAAEPRAEGIDAHFLASDVADAVFPFGGPPEASELLRRQISHHLGSRSHLELGFATGTVG